MNLSQSAAKKGNAKDTRSIACRFASSIIFAWICETGLTLCKYLTVFFMRFRHSSGTIINSTAGTQTVYMYGNAIKGTTSINSVGITNAQTNTADAQGNVILN